MSESIQHKLSKVRRPRVHITYDVHVGDAVLKKEIPYVVGVLANLSGMPKDELPPVRERPFVRIDGENFELILNKSNARVVCNVKDTVSGNPDDTTSVELNFKSMEDFEPYKLVEKIPNLSEITKSRELLQDLLSKLEGSILLKNILKLICENKNLRNDFAKLISERKALIQEKNGTSNKVDEINQSIQEEIKEEVKTAEANIKANKKNKDTQKQSNESVNNEQHTNDNKDEGNK